MQSNITAFYFINQLSAVWPASAPMAIFLAKYAVLLLAAAFVFYWFYRKQDYRMMLVSAACAAIMGFIAARIAGLLHHNVQPFASLEHVQQLVQHTIDNSFPSDHTALFFAICTSFFLFKLAGRYVWLVLAILVALSRVVVGVHYPLDVFVGALIGIACALLAFFIVPKQAVIQRLLACYQHYETLALTFFCKKNPRP